MNSNPKLIQLIKELSSLDLFAPKEDFAEIFCQIVSLVKESKTPTCVIREVLFPMSSLSELLNFEGDSLCGIKFVDCDLKFVEFDISLLAHVEFERCILPSNIKDTLLKDVIISGKGEGIIYGSYEIELDNVRVVNSSIYGSSIHDAVLCNTTFTCK